MARYTLEELFTDMAKELHAARSRHGESLDALADRTNAILQAYRRQAHYVVVSAVERELETYMTAQKNLADKVGQARRDYLAAVEDFRALSDLGFPFDMRTHEIRDTLESRAETALRAYGDALDTLKEE